MFTEATTDPQETIRAKDVLIPALLVLAQAKRLEVGGLTSHQIQHALEPAMVLSEKDTEKMGDRTTRFSRTVRNALVSHQMLEREGWAQSSRAEGQTRVQFEITPKGQSKLFDHMLPIFQSVLPPIEMLLSQDVRPNVVEGAPRVSSSEVKDVALLALALAQDAAGGEPVSPTAVRRVAKGLPTLQVAPEDLEPLPSHKAGRLDRTFRNITSSHDALVKAGFARRTEQGLAMTEEGKAHLLNTYVLRFLPSPPSLEAAAARMENTAPAQPSRSRGPGM